MNDREIIFKIHIELIHLPAAQPISDKAIRKFAANVHELIHGALEDKEHTELPEGAGFSYLVRVEGVPKVNHRQQESLQLKPRKRKSGGG
jgi:hypothetical protein